MTGNLKKIRFCLSGMLIFASFLVLFSGSYAISESAWGATKMGESITVVNHSGYAITGLYFAQRPNKTQWDQKDEAEFDAETAKNILADNSLANEKSFEIKLKYPSSERKRYFIRVKFENGNSYSITAPIPGDYKIILTKQDAE